MTEQLQSYAATLANLPPTELLAEYELAEERFCTEESKGIAAEFVKLARREVARRLKSQ